MRRKLGLALVILAGLAPGPLRASFHEINIVQIFWGSAAHPDAQYVMLQMWAAGQNLVGGQSLTVFNGDGSPNATLPFPAFPGGNVDNGANQDVILIGTADAAALFGVTMDLVISPIHTTGTSPAAKICWAGTYDCVSFGPYGGTATGAGTPFKQAEFHGLALTRRLDVCGSATALELCDDTNDSASDLILGSPAPRNNARVSGTLPDSTCGNNTLEDLEDCDDGNTTSGDGCSSVCFREPVGAQATALEVDTVAGPASDANGVLDPGESATLRPSWKNVSGTDASMVGAAAHFQGPAGGSYSILDGVADYGIIGDGNTATCNVTADCYTLKLGTPAARPAVHWDASFDEVAASGLKTWTLHVGDSFTDVPRSYLFYRRVETVLHHGITAGCSATQYCPDDKVRRDQMGLFLGRAIAKGGVNIPQSGTVGASPYDCTSGGVSLFADVAPTDPTCKAIHYIASKNVTGGCGSGGYCVSQNVTRAEMGIFVARGMVQPGGGAAVPLAYGPDPVTARSYSCEPGSPNLNFTDITTADSFCKHVHYLWAKGVVSGCTPTAYCVAGEVTRGEMARFLSNAFAPNLYEP